MIKRAGKLTLNNLVDNLRTFDYDRLCNPDASIRKAAGFSIFSFLAIASDHYKRRSFEDNYLCGSKVLAIPKQKVRAPMMVKGNLPYLALKTSDTEIDCFDMIFNK